MRLPDLPDLVHRYHPLHQLALWHLLDLSHLPGQLRQWHLFHPEVLPDLECLELPEYLESPARPVCLGPLVDPGVLLDPQAQSILAALELPEVRVRQRSLRHR